MCLMLIYDYIQWGAKALVGKLEFINFKIFEAVDYN
jgi:hypothetical protein